MKNTRVIAITLLAGALSACGTSKSNDSASPTAVQQNVCSETIQQTYNQFVGDAEVCKSRPEVRDLEDMVDSCRRLRDLLAGSSCTAGDGRLLTFDVERQRFCADASENLRKKKNPPAERPPVTRPPSERPPTERPPGKPPEELPPRENTDLSKLERIQRVQFRVVDAGALLDVTSKEPLPPRSLVAGRVFNADETMFAILRGRVACSVVSNESRPRIERNDRWISVSVQGPDKIADIQASRLTLAMQRKDGEILLLNCYGKHDPTPAQIADALGGVLQTLSAE